MVDKEARLEKELQQFKVAKASKSQELNAQEKETPSLLESISLALGGANKKQASYERNQKNSKKQKSK